MRISCFLCRNVQEHDQQKEGMNKEKHGVNKTQRKWIRERQTGRVEVRRDQGQSMKDEEKEGNSDG